MRIIFTVTNDLNYDQRMQRICSTIASNGFDVLLVGRKLRSSIPFLPKSFAAKRLRCFFNSGFLFYFEYNLRLFIFLLFQKCDGICAIDLDTILPVYFVSALRRKERIYDAHELFTEQKEIVSRKNVQRIWLAIEKFTVPKFKNGYTVNLFIRDELKRRYGVNYGIVRNLPLLDYNTFSSVQDQAFIVYQGAVNEGRSFETLIPAMKDSPIPLHIYGRGNFFKQAKDLIALHQLEENVKLFGYVEPSVLKTITPAATIAVTLFERTGLNQYYSLSNRFFDYIMAGVPQICVNYPEYKAINDVHNIALMIDDTDESTIKDAVLKLLQNETLYKTLRENCMKARKVLNWQEEEKKLVAFYRSLFNSNDGLNG